VSVKRLEAAKLVKREIDSADLRRHKLSPTPEDRKIMIGGLALLAEAFSQRFGRLSATHQAENEVAAREAEIAPTLEAPRLRWRHRAGRAWTSGHVSPSRLPSESENSARLS
jgi:hypothetical protein